MVTIGVDPHKQTHSAVAVNEVGGELDGRTAAAVRDGFGTLLLWARALPDPERVWVIEDCRHVSGPLERFLLDFGEAVVMLAPHLMAGARQSVRERGKSDLLASSTSNTTPACDTAARRSRWLRGSKMSCRLHRLGVLRGRDLA